MIDVRFTAQSVSSVDAAIRRLIETRTRLRNRTPVLEKIKKDQIKRWLVNFDGEGSEYDPWAPLAEATIEDRFYKGFDSGPILVRTGAHAAHFIEQNEAGVVSDDAVNWNFRDKGGKRGDGGAYLLTHHLGEPNPWGPMPARILWDLDEQDLANAEKKLDAYVGKIVTDLF